MPSSQQLYLFDCDRQVEISVPNEAGSIVIGRDSILQCNDTRISRNHGTLKVDTKGDGGGLQITSTHSNPIFIRTGADGVLNILAKDLTATLQKGDKFALLPDQYWYEVRLREQTVPEVTGDEVSSTGPTLRVRTMEEVNSGPIPEEVVAGEKRKNAEDSEADCSKKIRTEETPDQPPAEAEQAPETTSSEATSEPTTVIKPDPDANSSSPDEGTSSKSPQDSTANPVEVKKETADSSTGPPLRPSCQFGIACYRHTPDHRAQFAHPHDTDYRRPTFPPAPADAPHCPFGASCYRRNPQHFRDLQHPDSSRYSLQPPSSQRRPPPPR